MKHRERNGWLTLLAVVALIPFLFPFAWMLLGSFKSQADFLRYPPVWVFRPTLDNYVQVFTQHNFLQYAVNSTIVATLATAIGLVLGIPAAYAVARFRRTRLGLFLLAARMAPGISFLIPWFVLFIDLHLIGTYTALVASHLIITMPLIVWMMIGFIEAVPVDIEQASRIDGCSVFGVLVRIVVPLTAQGIAAAAILAFIFSWNNFLFSVILSNEATKTLPAAVYNFMGYESINWGPLTAAASVITVPVLALALAVQRYIVQGLVAGGISG